MATPVPPTCSFSRWGALQFFKVGSAATPFPNANSAYIGALYTPKQGSVVVMRALMPTTSSGTSPQVWPGGNDLRYWSICNYVHKAPYPAVETVVGGTLGRLALYELCHSGPSLDFASRRRPLDEVQRRGRWVCFASVRRYEN